MEKVCSWCGQPSDRGSRTAEEQEQSQQHCPTYFGDLACCHNDNFSDSETWTELIISTSPNCIFLFFPGHLFILCLLVALTFLSYQKVNMQMNVHLLAKE